MVAAKTSFCSILELPREVFGLILDELPFSYIFQLRLVCKKWNALLHDTHFFEESCQLTKRAPLCVCHSKEGFAAYIPETSSWHILPLSFILMEPYYRYDVFGRADGLLLVEYVLQSKVSLYLVNPMTRFHRKLPESICESCGTILGMVFDESGKSYKIFGSRWKEIVIYDPDQEHYNLGSRQELYMYDPETDSFEIICKCESGENLDQLTFHRDVLHYLSTKRNRYRIPMHMVFSDCGGQVRDELSGVWRRSRHQLTAAQTPQGLGFVRLFEWQGKLILVGGKCKDDSFINILDDYRSGYVLSVQVWELDEEENVWMEKTKMPEELRCRFSPESDPMMALEYFCDCSGDYVYLTSYSRYEMFAQHIMCNLSNNSWLEVPKQPFVSKSESLESPPDYTWYNDYEYDYERERGVLGCFLWKPSFEKVCSGRLGGNQVAL